MMKKTLLLFLIPFLGTLYLADGIDLTITRPMTLDSLGACQGVSYLDGRAYIYGDREVGMIRTYTIKGDSMQYVPGSEIRLTLNGQDVINHPTGIAHNGSAPTFIGNSIRLNPEGTKWRAVIYSVDWRGLQRTKTLDGNLLATIEDDTCVQGTRPEYVRYQNRSYVATADYGPAHNEVRLYDPQRLARAKKTSETGVLVKKFSCSPWVQNLHWIPEKNVLVLIQNQMQGRRWRFTFLDFPKSVESGHEVVLKTIDLDRPDELEGFTLTGDASRGLAVSSSQKLNANWIKLNW
jgi:hypothetical protein